MLPDSTGAASAVVKPTETERTPVARGCGAGTMGAEAPSGTTQRALAAGRTEMRTYSTPPNCTLNNGDDGKVYIMYILPPLKTE